MLILKIAGIILLELFLLIAIVLVIALLFLELAPTVGNVPDREKQKEYAAKTNLFFDGKFHNEVEFSNLTGHSTERSDRITPPETLPAHKIKSIERADKGELKITWLGHSSSLVQMGDQNILIDPIMSDRASPVSFAGSKRFAEKPLDIETIPKIDVLFVSHDHYDHLDYKTIQAIDNKVKNYVVPLGVEVILTGWGIDESKLHPLGWWESIEINGVVYTLTPGRHFTGRNPFKNNAAWWGGLYMNDGAHSVYFTGDTGYYDLFGRVYERLGAPDVMLGECGQYSENWANTHMFPEQTVQAAKDAHAKWLIPVHWGAFALSTHAWDDPPTKAVKSADGMGMNIATPKIGQTVKYEGIEKFTERWWEKE